MVLLKTTINLLEEISQVVECNHLLDVTVQCSDGQVKASGFLMAAASVFWKEMLLGNDDPQVHLDDETVECFRSFTSSILNGEAVGVRMAEKRKASEPPAGDPEEENAPLSQKRKRRRKKKFVELPDSGLVTEQPIKLEPERVKLDVDVDAEEPGSPDGCQHAADVARFLNLHEAVCVVAVDESCRGQVVADVHQALHVMCKAANVDVTSVLRNFRRSSCGGGVRFDNVYGFDSETTTLLFKNQDEFERLELDVAEVLLAQADAMPAREIRLQPPVQVPCQRAEGVLASPAAPSAAKLSNGIQLVSDMEATRVVSVALATQDGSELLQLFGSDADHAVCRDRGRCDTSKIFDIVKRLDDWDSDSIVRNLRENCGLIGHRVKVLKYQTSQGLLKAIVGGRYHMPCRGCKDKFRCLTMIDKREYEQHKIQCFGFKFVAAPRNTRAFISDSFKVIDPRGKEEGSEPSCVVQEMMVPAVVNVQKDHVLMAFLKKDYKCVILMKKGETNTSVIHTAAHHLSSLASVDHRRIYKAVKYPKAPFFISTFSHAKARSALVRGTRKKGIIQEQVYEKIRRLQVHGQTYDFSPPKEAPPCNHDYFAYDVSDDTSEVLVANMGRFQLVRQELNADDVSRVCLLSPCSAKDVRKQLEVVSDVRLRSDVCARRRKEVEDDPELEVDHEKKPHDLKAQISSIVEMLATLVPDRNLLVEALEDRCPFIQYHLKTALRDEAMKAMKEIDRTKTCPCGTTFPVFTHAEYVLYNRHLCKYHRDLDKYIPFLCPMPGCNIRRTSQGCLDKHVEDSHGDLHVCRHCGKKFRKLHLNSHETKCTKIFKCKVCGKELSHQQVAKHMSDVHSTKPCTCEFCGKVFKQALYLKRHQSNVHQEDGDKKWKCGICGKGFMAKSKYLRHLNGKHQGQQQ